MNSKEFLNAVDNIVKEKNIDPDVVYDAMELALTSAYKKNFKSKTNVKVSIDRETGEIRVYSYLTVVDDDKMTKEEYEDYLFEHYTDEDEEEEEIEEAEDTIIDYIKKSENKAEYREYKVLKNKYKVLKYFSIFILILNLISIILFYK